MDYAFQEEDYTGHYCVRYKELLTRFHSKVSWTFFNADIFTRHNRKSTGVKYNSKMYCIPSG